MKYPRAEEPDRGRGTVCLPEMRSGGVGLCLATLIARIDHNAYSPVFGWRSQEQAWAQTQGQLAWYRAMEDAGQMRLIKDAESLRKHLQLWESSPSPAELMVRHPFQHSARRLRCKRRVGLTTTRCR